MRSHVQPDLKRIRKKRRCRCASAALHCRSVLTIAVILWSVTALAWDATSAQAAQAITRTVTICSSSSDKEIKLVCKYHALPEPPTSTEVGIALISAAISFELRHESHMQVDLTFTNRGKVRSYGDYDVFLVIDDEKAKNHLRRLLPHVSLRGLEPGKPVKFSETLLAPAFSPGDYAIYLWIPSAEPGERYNFSKNLLLQSAGVARGETGLNAIATFRSKR